MLQYKSNEQGWFILDSPRDWIRSVVVLSEESDDQLQINPRPSPSSQLGVTSSATTNQQSEWPEPLRLKCFDYQPQVAQDHDFSGEAKILVNELKGAKSP